MDEWLTRTSHNQITGPFTQAEVCQKIQKGELKLQDEVCAANGYWFYLHESEEVRQQLGVQVPRMKSFGQDDEVTQTQTQTGTAPLDEDRTDPELRRPPALSAVPSAVPPSLSPPLDSGFEGEETTLVQPFHPKPPAPVLRETSSPKLVIEPARIAKTVTPILSELKHESKVEVRGQAGIDRSVLVWSLVIGIFVVGLAAVLMQVFGLMSL